MNMSKLKAPRMSTRTYYRSGQVLYCIRHASETAKDNGWKSLAEAGAMKEKMRHYNDETYCELCRHERMSR